MAYRPKSLDDFDRAFHSAVSAEQTIEKEKTKIADAEAPAAAPLFASTAAPTDAAAEEAPALLQNSMDDVRAHAQSAKELSGAVADFEKTFHAAGAHGDALGEAQQLLEQSEPVTPAQQAAIREETDAAFEEVLNRSAQPQPIQPQPMPAPQPIQPQPIPAPQPIQPQPMPAPQPIQPQPVQTAYHEPAHPGAPVKEGDLSGLMDDYYNVMNDESGEDPDGGRRSFRQRRRDRKRASKERADAAYTYHPEETATEFYGMPQQPTQQPYPVQQPVQQPYPVQPPMQQPYPVQPPVQQPYPVQPPMQQPYPAQPVEPEPVPQNNAQDWNADPLVTAANNYLFDAAQPQAETDEPEIVTPVEEIVPVEEFAPIEAPEEAAIEEDFTPAEAPAEDAIEEDFAPAEAPAEDAIEEDFAPVEAPAEDAIEEDFAPVEAPAEDAIEEDFAPAEAPAEAAIEEDFAPAEAPVLTDDFFTPAAGWMPQSIFDPTRLFADAAVDVPVADAEPENETPDETPDAELTYEQIAHVPEYHSFDVKLDLPSFPTFEELKAKEAAEREALLAAQTAPVQKETFVPPAEPQYVPEPPAPPTPQVSVPTFEDINSYSDAYADQPNEMVPPAPVPDPVPAPQEETVAVPADEVPQPAPVYEPPVPPMPMPVPPEAPVPPAPAPQDDFELGAIPIRQEVRRRHRVGRFFGRLLLTLLFLVTFVLTVVVGLGNLLLGINTGNATLGGKYIFTASFDYPQADVHSGDLVICKSPSIVKDGESVIYMDSTSRNFSYGSKEADIKIGKDRGYRVSGTEIKENDLLAVVETTVPKVGTFVKFATSNFTVVFAVLAGVTLLLFMILLFSRRKRLDEEDDEYFDALAQEEELAAMNQ